MLDQTIINDYPVLIALLEQISTAEKNKLVDKFTYSGELDFDAAEAFVPYYVAMKAACESGHLELVERLLAIDTIYANISINQNKFLRCAARGGNLAIVDRLLTFPSVDAQIAAKDNDTLYWAANKGHSDVFNRLITDPRVQANIVGQRNQTIDVAVLNVEKQGPDSPCAPMVATLLAFAQVRANLTPLIMKTLNKIGITAPANTIS